MLTLAATRFKALNERGVDGTPRHTESDERNMYLEVVLLHARALDEFLRPVGKRPSDLQPTHFVTGTLQGIEVLEDELCDRINKQLGHLTTTRLRKESFPYERIIRTVLMSVVSFIRQTPDERRAWFAEAEEHATRAVALFPRPGRGPFDGPVVTTTSF